MEDNKKLIENKEFKTCFLTPLEIQNYMSILGSKRHKGKNYLVGKHRKLLEWEVDSQWKGIVFKNLPEDIKALFNEYDLRISNFNDVVFDLEGLILVYTALQGENIEEKFKYHLENAKIMMLERVIDGKTPLGYEGEYSEFDSVVTPYLHDEFDKYKFIDECVFNTTGYYEKDNYNKCILFQWYEKKHPNNLYAVTSGRWGYWTTIKREKTDQQLYHSVSLGNEQIEFRKRFNTTSTYDKAKGEIKTTIDYKPVIRKATKEDIKKIAKLVDSFISSASIYYSGKQK